MPTASKNVKYRIKVTIDKNRLILLNIEGMAYKKRISNNKTDRPTFSGTHRIEMHPDKYTLLKEKSWNGRNMAMVNGEKMEIIPLKFNLTSDERLVDEMLEDAV